MGIAAIETKYKGYRFRSRLEARWAVFFDSLGIEWDYEPEGFEFESQIFRETDGGMTDSPSGRYLPDFLLKYGDPTGCIWAEVKPVDLTDAEHAFCELLTINTKKPTVLLVGTPEIANYETLVLDAEFRNAKSWFATLWDKGPRINFLAGQKEVYALGDNREYTSAVNAARSARFEHGECG